jgi:hypothetical protein
MTSVASDQLGLASGINSSLTRLAGVFAIAVLGPLMLALFAQELTARVGQLGLPAAAVEHLARDAAKLGATPLPPGLEAPAAAAVQARSGGPLSMPFAGWWGSPPDCAGSRRSSLRSCCGRRRPAQGGVDSGRNEHRMASRRNLSPALGLKAVASAPRTPGVPASSWQFSAKTKTSQQGASTPGVRSAAWGVRDDPMVAVEGQAQNPRIKPLVSRRETAVFSPGPFIATS